MADLSDEEVAERFADMALVSKLDGDPIYRALMNKAELILVALFTRMDELGGEDLESFVINIPCPSGKHQLHPVMKVQRINKDGKFTKEEDLQG